MIFQPSHRRRPQPREFVIQTPSAGIVKLSPENAKNAKTAVRAFERDRWPLTWPQLYAQGYRVVGVPRRK